MGDFDLAYNGELISQKFPPTMSVEPMRYESYQPPLYYLVATPIYGLVAGFGPNNRDGKNGDPYGTALIALRLFGVLLAAISLGLLYACAATIFPARPTLSIGATAFAAALPMHAAMTAAVNNDTLAELLILASVLVLLRWMQQRLMSKIVDMPAQKSDQLLGGESGIVNQASSKFYLLLLGLLLGLGLLTKVYVYALLPVCLLMVLLITWRTAHAQRTKQTVANVSWVLAPALLIGLPMWIRTMRLYGLLDPLGLAWHDLVVAGQPTLGDWITQHGWSAYWERALSFTFRSFWGVFGWLGIFLDGRIYTLLTIFSAAVTFGIMWALGRLLISWRRRSNGRSFDQFQRWALLFLGLMLLMVAACYALYNLKFVQHQGRYLFWGLLPIGLLMAAGWREVIGSVYPQIDLQTAPNTRLDPQYQLRSDLGEKGGTLLGRFLGGYGAGIIASIFTGALSLWLSTAGFTQMSLGQINKWTLLSGGLLSLLILLNSLLYAQISNATLSTVEGTGRMPYLTHQRLFIINSALLFNFMLPFMLLFSLSIFTAIFKLKI